MEYACYAVPRSGKGIQPEVFDPRIAGAITTPCSQPRRGAGDDAPTTAVVRVVWMKAASGEGGSASAKT